MSDPIDRQAAIDALIDALAWTWSGTWSEKAAIDAIKNLPSAQPELIRCKDCKHYNAGFECLIEGYGIERDKDWFCGSAERKEEDD